MGVILGADADANDDPTGCPLIGYDNLVTTTNITSTTEATGFPISNVANPATHLKWQGGVNTGDEYVTISSGFSDTVSYLGIAKHNFGSAGIVASVEGNDPAQILLHLDGGNSPDFIFDSNSLGSSHTWTAHGNANQATTTYKFGGMSLVCDGTGDYVDTPDHADFVLGGSDFTIDVWLNCTAVANLQKRIAGQYTGLAGTTSWLMYRSTANVYRFVISDGSSVSTDYATTTVFHSASNTGWHHFAVTRSGNTIRLFIDGTQEGGDHTFTGNVPDSSAVMEVGTAGNSEWWQGNIDEFRFLVGAAQWTANFTPPSTPYGWQELANGTEDATNVLLHFDGTDASTSIVDSNTAGRDHTWSVTGTVALDTADSKFGGASLLCDGSGSVFSTTLGADIYLGSEDFTIDLWFNCNAAGGTQKRIAGQYPTGVAAEDAWNIFRQTTNVIICTLSNGTTETSITGTTQFTSAANTGWHHLAFVRSGNTIKMFIDGVQEGGNVSFTGSVPSLPTTSVTVGEFAGTPWVGWLDEFRMTVGTARWTTTGFTVPSTADSGTSAITTDDPIIFRWAPVPIAGVRLHMRPVATAPEAAVIYVGELLVLERSIDINPKHVPITYGRRTNIVNGMSETGNFLGRVVLGEYRESKAEFEWFTPEFYRSDVDAFLDAAQEAPFFWAWSPDEYPAEVGFVWLTNNAEPEVDPVTRRIGLELQMRGIA